MKIKAQSVEDLMTSTCGYCEKEIIKGDVYENTKQCEHFQPRENKDMTHYLIEQGAVSK